MTDEKPVCYSKDDFLPITTNEKQHLAQIRPPSTYFRKSIQKLLKKRSAVAGAVVLALIMLTAILVPLFWPYSYDCMLGVMPGKPNDPSYNNLPPFSYGDTEIQRIEAGEMIFPHVFGTDALGRDYFIRVIFGARIALVVGVAASLIAIAIGTTLGTIAGYYGGWRDILIMRIGDIIFSLPDMLIVILLSTALKYWLESVIQGTVLEVIGCNLISLLIVYGTLYWVSIARLVRGQLLSLREKEYVLSAYMSGAKSKWIIKRHLLPNCIGTIIIHTTLQIPRAIFAESYLSFLGLGVKAPMPSLGSLAADAMNGITSYPYRLFFPAAVIFLIVLSLNLFGNGLRDAFDPRM